VSFESLPEPNAELCTMPGIESESLPAAIVAMEKLPAQGTNLVCALPTAATTASASPLAASAAPAAAPPLAVQEVTAGVGTSYQARTRAGLINKKAARYLKDPGPAWSAIAVNAENDMVVVTDENLFRIVELWRCRVFRAKWSRRESLSACGVSTTTATFHRSGRSMASRPG
jgi:hypothetical protein